ncbi:endo-1,4-beta-xylanase [Candidatus Uhrbacteria bacterium]|nr:endo-1,4-beta-xylanase [Candidatus Uhrbacteria bacterium]
MKHHHSKYFYMLASLATVLTLAMFTFAFVWLNTRSLVEPTFGVTFSWVYALQLGQDPVKMYQALVNDLGVRHVRLPLYWSEIERAQGEYDWAISDNLLAISEDRGVEVTLVTGMKVPRWPECYIPDWAESFNEDFQRQAVLAFIEESVIHYKGSSAIIRWQVENEPFFPYGECPSMSVVQFKERVDLVRSLDDRPIQVTVSGELGPWLDSAQAADILGISLYRQTWNDFFGYFMYPLTPEYYFFRASLVGEDVSQVVISELQAEPWFPEPIESRPLTQWYESFDVEMFNRNVKFAREVGVSEAYLWGSEWWYALKQAGDDRLWEAARDVFKTN